MMVAPSVQAQQPSPPSPCGNNNNGPSSSAAENQPQSMADALTFTSPDAALLSLSSASESMALALAKDLAASLDAPSASGSSGGSGSNKSSDGGRPKLTKSSSSNKQDKDASKAASESSRYPIPLPPSLHLAALQSSASRTKSIDNSSAEGDGITTALLCSESILSSLTKVASGGSRASTEMRSLETQRRTLDDEATDIATALKLRHLATVGADSLGKRLYAEAARAVAEYDGLNPTQRAVDTAGPHTVQTYQRTRDVLRRSVLERYEGAVGRGDVAGLSELTPLLGMLGLADKGVGLYLRYSQATLGKTMSLEEESAVEAKQKALKAEEQAGVRISRAEQRRRDAVAQPTVTVCTKLAKIYNTAVTHLRHHLPMVTYALGEADGDAALVQLVHLEVEKRAIQVIRDYANERRLADLEHRAERVAVLIEDKYLGGMIDDGILAGNNLAAMMGGGGGGVGGVGGADGGAAAMMEEGMQIRPNAEENDCGFTIEVGRLSDIDAAMDEAALLLQHTESYERFVRHACDEVNKARDLRRKNKREERLKRKKEEEARLVEAGQQPSPNKQGSKADDDDLDAEYKPIEILPPHTQLNEIVSEIGGYYTNLERSLLLAGMQRAFLNASYPSERNYSPLATLSASSHHRTARSAGCRALQTSVVEECLYASQRSTLRAFATGHTGTAAAAANFCADTLGRVLLEVLCRRAEMGTQMLKPGEGLLVGQGGLGSAALAVVRDTAMKGVKVGGRKFGGGGSAPTSSGGTDEATERALLQQRINMGIARACANTNDLEVAVDYTRRLEAKFLAETQNYPRGHETEQLRMCIKSLGPVTESFVTGSNRAVEQLVETVMPRVRSIVNDAVGQESTTSASFMGSAVVGGGTNAAASTVRMNYDLDDDAFELAQVSEGYISRLCSTLDELIEPLRTHLAPRLSDALILGVLGGASKRLEAAVKRTKFTALGALSLDSDVRYFVNYGKERIDSAELNSNVALYKACTPLARLAQIALLMNVDDLDDVLDLISASKRKGNWDLKLDDAKAFLSLRVDFEGRKVNELLRLSEGEE